MGIALEKGDETSVLRLDGPIGIGCAAELKQALIEALETGRPVKLALDGASSLDVTALQTIWAASRAAEERGKPITLCAQLPEQLSASFSDAGLVGPLVTAQNSGA